MKHTTAIALAPATIMMMAAAASAQQPQGPVFSSEPNLRVEFVHFTGVGGGTAACTEDLCTITAGSPAVLEVRRTSTGTYFIEFAPGTFAENPTCTISSETLTLSLGEANGPNEFGIEFLEMEINPLAPQFIAADQRASVICVG